MMDILMFTAIKINQNLTLIIEELVSVKKLSRMFMERRKQEFIIQEVIMGVPNIQINDTYLELRKPD
jgi:hypothetical protein